jgi:predicted lipoprotein with Yx(FWY)xxD motif
MTGCATAWPAVAPPASGSPTAGSGVSGQLTVITASDGSKEVAYNGWPLHTFQGDGNAPGMTNGNGIQSFGGTWHVVTPTLAASGGSSSGYSGGRYGGGYTPSY